MLKDEVDFIGYVALWNDQATVLDDWTNKSMSPVLRHSDWDVTVFPDQTSTWNAIQRTRRWRKRVAPEEVNQFRTKRVWMP